ncbi:VOC family protein [Streptomyces mangrovisoli]|uniref:Dioxygenase n=1 Tax=Streptomyces mangrovisoli TaxID=1428628 RepID=A0A1J4NUW3_9ACTN|nr:VOC family protein [Streptomyces mangrovisoli]OIJ65029.1 dioxygenase [Streptomyces mangrovisoli]
MPLHGMASLTFGVPNIAEVTSYYEDFGLDVTRTDADGTTHLATVEGGEQLHIAHAGRRRLLAMTVGADDQDDLDRIASQLARLGLDVSRGDGSLSTREPGTDVQVSVEIRPRVVQTPTAPVVHNGPGRQARLNERAPGIERTHRVRPRKLGHVVLGSTNQPGSQKFFTEGLGFKVSDEVKDQAAFMRCSTDHHNVLVQAAPVTLLHHTSWQVDDVDEIGRGAMSMLEEHPDRHVWGLGRHHIGSNFFWYLKDPAGNFSEYYSDMDCIVDDELWEPGVWDGIKSLYNWGPKPPDSFLAPEDLAAHMSGAHVD